MDGITVTRIGTQVVVRLSGDVDDARRGRLAAAVDEVARLALQRVVVDLDDVTSIEGAGIDFIVTLHSRWRVKLLNTPADVRARLPRQERGGSGGPGAGGQDATAGRGGD